MDELLKQTLTLYGPLGFGWIAAGYLFMRNSRIVDRYHDLTLHVAERFEASTAAQTELKTIVLERLK